MLQGRALQVQSLLGCILICIGTSQQVFLSEEERVIKNLFLDDPEIAELRRIARPPGQQNVRKPVKIYLYYSLLSLDSFDEQTGFITVQVYEHMLWTDNRLAWNVTKYPNLEVIRIPAKYVWIPDVTVYTRGSKGAGSDWLEERVALYRNSEIIYVPIRTFNLRCDIDLSDFPYDSQLCNLTLGSWMHSADEVEIVHSDTSSEVLENSHSSWSIQNFNLTSELVRYPCCPEQYHTLTLTIEIARSPKWYVHIFVAPVIALYFLLPAVHLIPPGSHEKGTIAGLLLLCTFLLNALLYQQISGFPEEKTPRLVSHYQGLMAMTVISIGVSSLTATLASTSHSVRKVPSPLRRLLGSLIDKFCCKLVQRSKSRPQEYKEMTPVLEDNDDKDTEETVDQSSMASAAALFTRTSVLAQLADELRFARKRRQLEMEWIQLATFVDRLTCIAFIFWLIIGLSTIEVH